MEQSYRERLLGLKKKAKALYKTHDQNGVSAKILGKRWSRLADITLQAALIEAWNSNPQTAKLYQPKHGFIPGLFLLGLGKLGGEDLNFSSDVDLIAFYDAERIPIPAHLGRTHLVAAVMRKLTKLLDKGLDGRFVWRVDWRLRPDPSVTDLAMSTEAAENFYFFRAAPWRRLAMVKARVVAGDFDCGQGFLTDLKPFVWRRHLDFKTLDEIATLKLKIKNEHPNLKLERSQSSGSPESSAFHLKLGQGGIREIEFLVNANQLLLGGRLPDLQTTNTMQALAVLRSHGRFDPETAKKLEAAYWLFRALENRVQYAEDRHEHRLPTDPETQSLLAHQSGFKDWPDLIERVTQARRFVSQTFASMLAGKEQNPTEAGAVESLMAIAQEQALPKAAFDVLTSWLQQPFQAYGIHTDLSVRLQGVGIALAKICLASREPNQSLMRVHGFILDLGQPDQYLRLFADKPKLLDLVFPPLLQAPAMATLLEQSAHVIDGLITQDLDEESNPNFETGRQMLAAASTYERKLEACRAWINEQLYGFYLGVHQQKLTVPQAETALSDLAVGALSLVAELVAQEHGQATRLPFAVLGMGKLGMRAMAPGSDLDLIFVVDNDQDYDQSQRLAKRFVAALDTPMREGRVYEIDMRLRPSGRAGPVVVSFSQFESYQLQRAKTWEHLALAAMQPVYGSDRLAAKVLDVKQRVLQRNRCLIQLHKDAVFMLDRLTKHRFSGADASLDVKLRKGGLMELEYLFNFLSLRHRVDLSTQDQSATGAVLQALGLESLQAFELEAVRRQLRDYNFYTRLYEADWPHHVGTEFSMDRLESLCSQVQSAVEQLLRQKTHFVDGEYATYQEVPVHAESEEVLESAKQK